MVSLVMALLRRSDTFSDDGPVPRLHLHRALMAAVLLLVAALVLAEALRLLTLLAEAVLTLAAPREGAGQQHQQQRVVQMRKLSQVVSDQRKGQQVVAVEQWEDAAGEQRYQGQQVERQQQQLWLC